MSKPKTIFLLCLFLTTIYLLSCNLEKRIERNQKKLDRIGKLWLKTHPCANDSSFVYVPGKTDSFYLPITELVPDTIQTKILIDSLIRLSINCDKEIKSAYATGYAKSTKDWRAKLSQTKIVSRVDTVKISVKDNQQEKILLADCTEKDAQLSELHLMYEKQKRKSDKWFLWFIISCLCFIISHSFKFIKNRFK
jgi:hypothetical protein